LSIRHSKKMLTGAALFVKRNESLYLIGIDHGFAGKNNSLGRQQKIIK
jgi:hypothetical protein